MEYPVYQHYIITRFNVKQSDWNDKNALLLLNESWLKERFKLFEDFCFPSVRAQTCKNFKWLVYFDTDTPEPYKKLIQSYAKALPNLLPVFIPHMEYLITSIKDAVLAGLDTARGLKNIIVTTRLDNDDLLHENFVQVVQSFIKTNGIRSGVIDIPAGYCLKIKPEPLLSQSTQFSNPFITYIEPYTSTNKLLTVMDRPHYKWVYSAKTFFIEKRRLWMQMIHEKNAFNKFQGVLVNNDKTFTPFHVNANITLKKKHLPQLLRDNFVTRPFYFIKSRVKKMLLKKQNSNTKTT